MTDTTPITNNLNAAREVWDELFPSLSETVPIQTGQQVPKSAFTRWFDLVIPGVRWAEEDNSDPILTAIHWPNIVNAIAQLTNHMNGAKQQGAPWLQQNTAAIQGYLWSIRATLTWLLPISDEQLIATRIPRVEEINVLAKNIIEASGQVQLAEKTAQQMLAALRATEGQASESVERISGHERGANTASTNATASAASAEAEKKKVDGYVTQLSEAASRQETLFGDFEEKRDLVDATLEGASKVALAKSFDIRRRNLAIAQYLWAIAFVIGIGALTWIGRDIGDLILNKIPLLNPSETVSAVSHTMTADIALITLRFLILAPLVWLTWFSARQYGHCQRLGADYAFKSAAAHAYVGYKNEMGEDDAMIKLLREYAVKNFGSNPIRVLERREPATPLSEILSSVVEKVSPDKIVDLIKAAKEK